MSNSKRWSSTDSVRHRILDGATRAFRENGYTATTLAEIVEESGASIGSIYHHFGDKEALFLAIADRLAESFEAELNHDQPDWVEKYLHLVWTNRDTVRLLVGTDTPPSYDALNRLAGLLVREKHFADQGIFNQLFIAASLFQAARLVLDQETRQEAEVIINATLQWLQRA